MGQSIGKKVYYLESPVTGWAQMPYNTKEVLTESGEWESPITGFVKVTCIGGGQAGSTIGPNSEHGFSGYPGTASSFASVYSRGGGGSGRYQGGHAGEVTVEYVYVKAGETYAYIVGAGGIAQASEPVFSDTYSLFSGGNYRTNSKPIPTSSNWGFQGGQGANNGTPYGGGGGAGGYSNNGDIAGQAGSGGGKSGGAGKGGGYGLGGDGGNGAIILEYADPKKKS